MTKLLTLALVALLVLIGCVSTAQCAETIKVAKAETLYSVASKFPGVTAKSLYLANKSQIDQRNAKQSGARKFWLYPGQELIVPTASVNTFKSVKTVSYTNVKLQSVKHASNMNVCQLCHIAQPSNKAKQVVAKSINKARQEVTRLASGVYLWTVAGGNPFGRRDHLKAFEMLPVHAELKKALAKAFLEVKPESATIEPGTDFNWILFGNYEWIRQARWAGKKALDAKVWRDVVEYNGRIYTIALTSVCNNLEISSRPVSPLPVKAPEPPKTEGPPVDLSTPTPVEPLAPTTPAEPATQPPTETKACWTCQPDYLSSIFAGYRRTVQHNGEMVYYGANVDLFCPTYDLGNKVLRIGASAEAVGWQGQMNHSEITYDGYQHYYGGVAQVLDNGNVTELRVRAGEKISNVEVPKANYSAKQENDLLNVDFAHTQKVNGKVLSAWQLGSHLNLDLGGEKEASQGGKKIANPGSPDNATEYGIRGRLEFVTPQPDWVVYTKVDIDHAESNHNTGIEPGAGLKWRDGILEGGLAYRFNTVGDDTWGPGVVIDAGKVIKWATREINAK